MTVFSYCFHERLFCFSASPYLKRKSLFHFYVLERVQDIINLKGMKRHYSTNSCCCRARKKLNLDYVRAMVEWTRNYSVSCSPPSARPLLLFTEMSSLAYNPLYSPVRVPKSKSCSCARGTSCGRSSEMEFLFPFTCDNSFRLNIKFKCQWTNLQSS